MHVFRLNPKNVEAHLNRGLAYYRQGDYQAAMPMAGYAYVDNNQVIALKPHDFRAYYNRGIARGMLGNHQQAILNYDLALTKYCSIIQSTKSGCLQ
ncbi:tetratricopeptide repeat protein [Nostoc sp.]